MGRWTGSFRLMLLALAFMEGRAFAYSANKVWMEKLDGGMYRVSVQYTVPEIKEFREAHAIFEHRKDAQTLYWQLLRGADFSVGGPAQIHYKPPKKAPEEW